MSNTDIPRKQQRRPTCSAREAARREARELRVKSECIFLRLLQKHSDSVPWHHCSSTRSPSAAHPRIAAHIHADPGSAQVTLLCLTYPFPVNAFAVAPVSGGRRGRAAAETQHAKSQHQTSPQQIPEARPSWASNRAQHLMYTVDGTAPGTASHLYDRRAQKVFVP
eukprot:2981842-Rhodomonas_salina.1